MISQTASFDIGGGGGGGASFFINFLGAWPRPPNGGVLKPSNSHPTLYPSPPLYSVMFLCREIRRIRKQKRKIKERLVQKAEMHKESAEMLRQEDLFRLKDIRKRSQLEEVEKGEMIGIEQSDHSDGEEEEEGSVMMSEGLFILWGLCTWEVSPCVYMMFGRARQAPLWG